MKTRIFTNAYLEFCLQDCFFFFLTGHHRFSSLEVSTITVKIAL